ncbi:MAG: LysM peptidoglycan-binding domain-containing protein [bacterium]
MFRRFFTLVAWGLIAGLCLGAETIHKIKKGDTLYDLSLRYHVAVGDILKANPGLKPASLRVGQNLKIPSSTPAQQPPPAPTPTAPPAASDWHVVQSGDTLIGIARKYGLSLEKLRGLNQLKSDVVRIGQKLRVRALITANPPPPPAPIHLPIPPPPLPRQTIEKKETEETPKNKPLIITAKKQGQEYVFVSKARSRMDAPRLWRRWKYIVVHHSGTSSGSAKIFDYYHSHVRGMENGLAYHFVIGNGTDSGDGEIEVGSRWTRQLQGGHLSIDALNEVSIGICLVGDFEKNRPTRRQIAALVELINYLSTRNPSGPPQFTTHREIQPGHTQCPGRFFPVKAMHQLFE